MKVVFVSNYYNHHQSAMSEEFFKQTNGQYRFIQTEPMDEERRNMGWEQKDLPSFVIESYRDKETYKQCVDLINSADVVIAGSAPEKMIRKRIRSGKLVFRYSERIYKNKKKLLQLPLRFIKYHFDNYPYKNVYMLCASAYAARDYAITGMFKGKTFKWGYFPAVKKYENIEKLIDDKTPASILWVARLIEWKHPDASIRIARRLKQAGYKFRLSLIGNGELENKIREMIKAEGVEDCVQMLGAMSPEDVRKYMEQSEIFLFTSDFNEGWGAVLNESMNSACAVVASHAIGAAPFLIRDGENGFIYKNGDENDLFNKVKFLLDNTEKRKEMSLKAYKTMTETWNAENAVKNFIKLVHCIVYNDIICFEASVPCEKI